jgi:hypothetical protein
MGVELGDDKNSSGWLAFYVNSLTKSNGSACEELKKITLLVTVVEADRFPRRSWLFSQFLEFIKDDFEVFIVVKTYGSERRPPRPFFEVANCNLKDSASVFVS